VTTRLVSKQKLAFGSQQKDSQQSLGFKSQALLLSRMFYFVESGKIQEPIYSADQAPVGTSNKDFLQEYIANLLKNAFNNLQE
jgi:exportin-1